MKMGTRGPMTLSQGACLREVPSSVIITAGSYKMKASTLSLLDLNLAVDKKTI